MKNKIPKMDKEEGTDGKKYRKVKMVDSFLGGCEGGNNEMIEEKPIGKIMLFLCMIPVVGIPVICTYFIVRHKEIHYVEVNENGS